MPERGWNIQVLAFSLSISRCPFPRLTPFGEPAYQMVHPSGFLHGRLVGKCQNAEEGWKAWGCSSCITQSHFKLKSHFKAHAFNLLTGMCFNLGKLCTVSWWTELSAEFDHITDGLKWARMSAQWGQLSTSVYRFRKTFIFRRLRDSGPSAFTRVLNWGHLNSGISGYQMFVWPAFSPIGSMCFVCSGERHICFSVLQASLMSLLAIP